MVKIVRFLVDVAASTLTSCLSRTRISNRTSENTHLRLTEPERALAAVDGLGRAAAQPQASETVAL
jgi:hypothetical protein